MTRDTDRQPTWPHLRFDPFKLFDLWVGDLVFQDPHFVRLSMDGYAKLGEELFVGLLGAPQVVAYLCDICPERANWLRGGLERTGQKAQERIRAAEVAVLQASFPWNLGMAKQPEAWDALPWSYWDPSVLYERVDLKGAVVLDVGAGTGQVAIRCAPYAKEVIALEPIARLRSYIKRKMEAAGLSNVRTLDGLLESIPLGDTCIDVAISSNGSFGWNPAKELAELDRVTKPGGQIFLLAPCNYGDDGILSAIDAAGGYQQFEMEIPGDGMKPTFMKNLSA